MMKVEMGKKYISGGQPVRILCINRNDIRYPIVGVRSNGNMCYFREDGSCASGEGFDLVKIWEPQAGEWCLFWHREESGNAILDKFIGISESGLFKACSRASWKYCAKFTGELPEHLKGL
jgi:hypothetical protein